MSLLPRIGLESQVLRPGAALVRRAGTTLFAHELDERTWVVQVGGQSKNLTIQPVEDRTWVVQRGAGRRRKLRRMGAPEARTHLLVDEKAARADLPHQQMRLFHYMAGQHLAWIVDQLDTNCVLDVGGNIGLFGQRLRNAGYAGRIVSFEPLPHLREQLLQRAQNDPDWHVMPYALGEETSEAEMTVVADQGQTSSLLPVSQFGKSWSPRLEGIRKETVQIRRLDEVFDEALTGIEDPRVFLKLDTQGYDLRAFAGGGDRLKEILGLQSEVSSVPIYDGMPHMTEAITAYEAAGFATTGIFPVTRDTRRHQVIEFDIMMIRPEAIFSSEIEPTEPDVTREPRSF